MEASRTEGNNPLRFRSVFVSDVHLGSRRCRAAELSSFLERVETRFLYVVGDIVDRWPSEGAAAWPESHREVLRAISDKATEGTRVSYLPGNHDGSFQSAWREREPELQVAKQMEHETADGRRFVVLHGDRFDTLMREKVWLGKLGDGLTAVLEAVARGSSMLLPRRFRGRTVTRFKQWCKAKSGYTGRFESSAIRWARERGAAGVICGHSHAPAIYQSEGLLYANDGDWVQSCTALVEHEDGRLEILRAA